MKGSIKRYCSCTDPATGRQFGARCPRLASDSKHGQWDYRDRLPSSTGERELRRRGFPTKKAASEFRDQVYVLLALARGDTTSLSKIGDLIFERTKRGGQLPAPEDVKRRLGLGMALDRSMTVRDALEAFFAAKKRGKRDSTLRSYRQHIDHYLIPQLGDFALDRCGALQISDLFDQIDEWNSEILLAREEGRRPILEGDLRKRAKLVGVATQHRILATLSNMFNWARKQKPVPLVDFNPCDAVELQPETREPARVWDPEQVGHFLDSNEDHPLYLLFRTVLIHGPRRGEIVGARRTGYSHKKKALTVMRPLLQLGGKIVESTPKTRAGERTLFFDDETNDGYRRHLAQQAKHRLAWGPAYNDHDLIFCWEDGTPYSPDYVSRIFKDLAVECGLPAIKLHEGRHTAATLRLEAGEEVKVVSEGLGHSKTAITEDLYQHVRRAMLDRATDKVIDLVPRRQRRQRVEETG